MKIKKEEDMGKLKFVGVMLSFLLIWGLCFPGYIFAQKKDSLEDKIIGSTFKSLVKAFVATANIDQLKEKYINKINKMEEKKFRERYAKIYQKVKGLPNSLKTKHEITEYKSRKQAIKDIESLNKKKIYQAMDSIPNKMIADNFKEYLAEKKQEMQKSNLVEQINKVWNKIARKTEEKPTK